MKPSFALNITDTAIGLLHRTARGWMQVGETAFDTADLAEALGYLRGSALGLSPGGLTTKLVLPNSQIRYLELDAPGPGDADRRNQIRAGLVGRTPYNVEDLVFDWSGTGARVQVAVVARETLDEAEAFAAEHRFNPVSFVGLPAKDAFKGEPWFGPTKLSVTVLEKGEKVERDSDVVQIGARDLPKSHPGAGKSSSASSDRKSDSAAKALADKEKSKDDQAATGTASPRPIASDLIPPAAAFSAAVLPPTADQPPARAFVDTLAKPDTAPAFSPVPTAVPAPIDTPQPPAPRGDGPPKTAPFTPGAAVADAGVLSDEDLPPAPSPAIMAAFSSRRAADVAGKDFGAPSSAFSDGAGGKSAPPPLSRPVVGADAAALRDVVRADAVRPVADAPLIKPAIAKPNTAFVTAPTIPGSRKRKTVQPDLPNSGALNGDTRKPLTKPGGTFASSQQRGKPKYLGLILTGLLLLFLALIAAWSQFVTSSSDDVQTGTAVASAPAADAAGTAEVPAVDDEMLADSQDPAEFDAESLAAADAVSDPEPAAVDVAPAAAAPVIAPEIAPEIALDPPAIEAVPVAVAKAAAPKSEPAPVGIATTQSPNPMPQSDAQDEIFLAMTDAAPMSLDPLALPVPLDATDALPLPQLEPPPFGTVYQFDAEGRIRPTPEGIITPAGVRLVAGKPSLVPPPRPAALLPAALPAPLAGAAVAALPAPLANPSTAAPVTADLPQPFPSDPALADARPRPRPANLAPPAVQADDDAALIADGDTRLAGLRPAARPAAVLAAGEAARQSTAGASLAAQAQQAAAVEEAVRAAAFQPDENASLLAVRVSRKPAARPQDMSRAVEAAVAAAVRAPEPQQPEPGAQPEADDEPETASAAPAIPTRASVAKQATYVNAINLSKINLIGVYGTKSSRYALIRQSNGRYKKVRVGDSIDGGRVAAINSDELRYQKSGRMVSLKLPRT